MSPLERRARWLLRVYPAAYRCERGEEIIGTLLEATPDGQTWPRARDVRALAVGGLQARTALSRQRTVGANVRIAVMAGLAIYVSTWAATYLYVGIQRFVPNSAQLAGGLYWLAAVIGLFGGATVVLAWTAPRAAVLACALAASVGVVAFGWDSVAVLAPHLVDVLSVLGLAALTPRAGQPSRHWLWLPGAFVAWRVLTLGPIWATLSYTWQQWTPGLPLVALAAGAVFWVGIDARLIVAVLTYFGLAGLQEPLDISAGVTASDWLPFLLIVAVIAAPAVWLLRRQSARPVG